MKLHNEYRQAKKFKLDEDGEVTDKFSGQRKKHLRRGYDSRREDGLYHKYPGVDRYLNRSVGMAWDDVYSAVCDMAKHHKPYVERFLRERTRNQVEMHAYEVDGVMHYHSRWGGASKLSSGELYVFEGMLCRMPVVERPTYHYSRSYAYWQTKPRHHEQVTVTVGDVIYWKRMQEYQRRIAPGVFKTVESFVWYKDVPYTYVSNHRTGDSVKGYVDTLVSETRYNVFAVAKKAVKKYKLNDVDK